MRFRVVDSNSQILPNTSGSWEAWLVRDNWDDFRFKTLFGAFLVGPDSTRIDLGGVKIANRGMQERLSTQPHPIPKEFERLDDSYYSLGQGVEYYETLRSLAGDVRAAYLHGIRDVAFTPKLVNEFITEFAFQKSLLRTRSLDTIFTQYYRISHGGPTHEAFAFEYRDGTQPPMTFDVRPTSSPPTNVHVVIGSNGVGKTKLLETFERLIRFPNEQQGRVLQIVRSEDGTKAFSNLGVIAFSAFDSFDSGASQSNSNSPRFYYYGLKKRRSDQSDQPTPMNDEGTAANDASGANLPTYIHKTVDDLVAEFKSLLGSLSREDLKRFSDSLKILSSDPLIEASQLASVSTASPEWAFFTAQSGLLEQEFRAMSSGHKIVLMAILGLISCVHEKTLVLIDEPETHLHPPLLSAFIRALSALLIDRNGVAVIATHSPVVLQEVPRNCVWKLSRFGESFKFERPAIETFGENVGTLTREIFGFQVSRTGFYHMLEELVEKHGSYENVFAALGGQLGAEGRALVQVLLANRRAQ